MKKLITTFILLAIVPVLSAHEFWLQPDKFIYTPGEAINIRFNVGENFEGENWSGDTSKVKSLNFYYEDIVDDLTPAMGTEKGDSVQLSVLDEGTDMVTFNSKNSFIQLDTAKFNAYLLEDGLNEAIEYRKEHNETDSIGREFYQRSVKTIFQVGKEFTNTFQQQTDLPLDIILQQNPYAFKDSETLTVKVFFQNEPLKNKQVKIWHRENGKTILREMLTSEDGEISFEVTTSGEWMVSCVKMIRLENDPKANWQSYWGSCTWGYEK
ncbi:MAG: DUF4198 domain-containing protein [Bacteroidota bacterium]